MPAIQPHLPCHLQQNAKQAPRRIKPFAATTTSPTKAAPFKIVPGDISAFSVPLTPKHSQSSDAPCTPTLLPQANDSLAPLSPHPVAPPIRPICAVLTLLHLATQVRTCSVHRTDNADTNSHATAPHSRISPPSPCNTGAHLLSPLLLTMQTQTYMQHHIAQIHTLLSRSTPQCLHKNAPRLPYYHTDGPSYSQPTRIQP